MSPNPRTKTEAEEAGYRVDTDCYPWMAYRGHRFSPTQAFPIITDDEARLEAINDRYREALGVVRVTMMRKHLGWELEAKSVIDTALDDSEGRE